MDRERQRMKDAGHYDDDQEKHLRKMFSEQSGDIPLDQRGKMRQSIKVLTDTFRPFDRFRKKK